MSKKIWFTSQDNKTIYEDINFAIKNWFNAYSLNLSYKSNLSYFNTKDLNSLKLFSEKWWTFIIHMPYYLPINTCIKEVFEWVIKYFENIIKIFSKYWLQIITLHGWYIESKNNNKISLKKNLNKLLEISKKYNIELSIENDDLWVDYPICTKDDIKEVMDWINEIKFCYDIWHYNTVEPKWISKIFQIYKNRINILHIHNNFWKDTHNSLNNWNIDIKNFLKLLKKEKYNNIIIFELKGYTKIIEAKKFYTKD